MGVSRSGVLGDGVVRLRCPKAERSGPCHGRVKLAAGKGRRVLASGSFRIPAGRRVSVTLKGRALPERAFRARVRVRGADLLGNRRAVTATVKLRRAG